MNEPYEKYQSVPNKSLNREQLPVERRPADIDGIPDPPHQSKFNKLANIGTLIALALIAMGIGTFLYWAAANENILEVKNSPFPVRTIRQHPQADGVVILTVNLCKNAELIGKTRTSFVSDSREIFLPVSEEKLRKGCLTNQEVPILIPKDTPPGNYKIKFRVTYDVNPIKRSVVNEFESKEFIVDAPGSPAVVNP